MELNISTALADPLNKYKTIKRGCLHQKTASVGYLGLAVSAEECEENACCDCRTDNACNVRAHCVHEQEV